MEKLHATGEKKTLLKGYQTDLLFLWIYQQGCSFESGASSVHLGMFANESHYAEHILNPEKHAVQLFCIVGRSSCLKLEFGRRNNDSVDKLAQSLCRIST